MVFLIIGPDTYRARQKLAELKNKFLKEVDPSGLNMHSVKGASLTLQEVRHHLESQPLLARRRFIVFDNVLSHKKAEVVQAIIKSLDRELGQKDGEDNIAVFFEDEEPKAKNKLHSWLIKYAHLFRFPLLEGRSLEAWLEEEFHERGRSITPKALRQLVSLAGSDLWQVSRELQKIDAYLEKGETVDEKTVVLITADPFDDNIFVLIDAIIAGELRKSAPLLMEHLGRETSPQQVIALLEKQLRTLILLVGADAPSSALGAGLHPYMIKKLTPLARRYDMARLKKIYAALLDVDVKLKSSAGDTKTLFLKFLADSALLQS